MENNFVPKTTEWFLGELVQEFKIAGEPDNVVHINTVLVKADSPESAYLKALSFGEAGNDVYTNLDGLEVHGRFRGLRGGLRGLYVIYEPLEDGAEILDEERRGMSEEAIIRMLKHKDALAVFSPAWEDGENRPGVVP
jgi:hypothetical protein